VTPANGQGQFDHYHFVMQTPPHLYSFDQLLEVGLLHWLQFVYLIVLGLQLQQLRGLWSCCLAVLQVQQRPGALTPRDARSVEPFQG
jgi:hypothetical protein